MTDDQTPENAEPRAVAPAPGRWATWLAWGWVLLLVLVAVAELTDWADLRLALDFQRMFR